MVKLLLGYQVSPDPEPIKRWPVTTKIDGKTWPFNSIRHVIWGLVTFDMRVDI